jgi:hypothetical protein
MVAVMHGRDRIGGLLLLVCPEELRYDGRSACAQLRWEADRGKGTQFHPQDALREGQLDQYF